MLWCKKQIRIRDVHVDNIVTSKLTETKNNSKYLIGYFDDVIRPLVLTLLKRVDKLEPLRIKDNKLMSFYMNNSY